MDFNAFVNDHLEKERTGALVRDPSSFRDGSSRLRPEDFDLDAAMEHIREQLPGEVAESTTDKLKREGRQIAPSNSTCGGGGGGSV